MNFKLDENVPLILKQIIEKSGPHQVETIFHENISGINDQQLIQLCKKEERILITQDNDFVNIDLFPDFTHCGIIIIKSLTQGKKAVKNIFERFLTNFDLKNVKNEVIIIESTQYKIRSKDIS
jgi:predicted nuclease of predicted toxin-antitoxin system